MMLPSLVKAYDALLINRHDTYCVQHTDGRYQRVYQRFDIELLARHLLGATTLAGDGVDRHGWSRWLCFDCDAPDGLQRLAQIQDQLADMALVSLRELSRRGGHLWLICAETQPALLLRRLAQGVLQVLRDQGKDMGQIEVYPDMDMPTGVKGVSHPVRLPGGVHQQTGQRYPFLDHSDRPCHRPDPEALVSWLVGQQRISSQHLHIALKMLDRLATPEPDALPHMAKAASYGVIRWANEQLDLLEVIAQTRPEVAPRPTGRGYIGWCPWHDDAVPQSDGRLGTPSLYLIRDSRYGWSWRCLSTNCGAYLSHKFYHTFDWLLWHQAGDLRHVFQVGADWQQRGGQYA